METASTTNEMNNWHYLYANLDTSALAKLENEIKVCWMTLSMNPNVIKDIDIEFDLREIKPFAEELPKYVFNPSRLMRMAQQFNMDLDEYMALI